jgi:hypothetical protein
MYYLKRALTARAAAECFEASDTENNHEDREQEDDELIEEGADWNDGEFEGI